VAVAVVAGVVLLRPRLPGPAAAVARPLRVAVLPFRDLGGDAEHAWFAAGMTEALTAELAQVSALRVISRASVSAVAEAAARPLAEIARQLDVGALVDGSVLRSGDRVRITAQLVDVAGDRTLWARNYDCDLQDVIDVQRRVAREIADEVRVTVTPREGERLARSSPVNPQAYEAYLIGRFHRERLTGDDLNVAREQFQRAIELDPGYAPAHAALADCYWIMGTAGFELRPQGETAPLARAAAERALGLDPELGSAEATLAMVEAYHDWNWDEAEVRLRRVIAANPSFSKAHVWYSGLLAATGRFDEAIGEARRGLDLDPLAATARQTLGWRYFYAGDFAHAEQEFRRTLVAEPGSFVARLGLGQTLLESGASDPLPELEQALRDAGDSPYALAALGNASARRGQGDRARKALDELAALARRRYVSPVYAAFVQVALGDSAAALDGLEAAFAERSGWMVYLPVQPELRPLRDEPRFRSLLLKVGHRPGPRRRPWTGGR
jgi:TolB-like protein/Tfp pilus assembly protein PilF